MSKKTRRSVRDTLACRIEELEAENADLRGRLEKIKKQVDRTSAYLDIKALDKLFEVTYEQTRFEPSKEDEQDAPD